MMNQLFRAICRTGVFVICAQALLALRPKEEYEKYLKLLVGVMILGQLFRPIGNILKADGMDGQNGLAQRYREWEMAGNQQVTDDDRSDQILEWLSREKAEQILSDKNGDSGEDPETGGYSISVPDVKKVLINLD